MIKSIKNPVQNRQQPTQSFKDEETMRRKGFTKPFWAALGPQIPWFQEPQQKQYANRPEYRQHTINLLSCRGCCHQTLLCISLPAPVPASFFVHCAFPPLDRLAEVLFLPSQPLWLPLVNPGSVIFDFMCLDEREGKDPFTEMGQGRWKKGFTVYVQHLCNSVHQY